MTYSSSTKRTISSRPGLDELGPYSEADLILYTTRRSANRQRELLRLQARPYPIALVKRTRLVAISATKPSTGSPKIASMSGSTPSASERYNDETELWPASLTNALEDMLSYKID